MDNDRDESLLPDNFPAVYAKYKSLLQIFLLFYRYDEFYKEDIIRMWEVHQEKALINEFEDDLIQKNIFKFLRRDQFTHVPRYKLRNSFVDFLQQNPCDGYARVESSIPDNTRHASFKDGTNPEILKQLCKIKSLETLLILHEYGSKLSQLPPDLFLNCPNLSVLHLSETNIMELPSTIGNSKLRYLNLSGTPITTLPNSLCNCSTMQILELRNCINLDVIPKGLAKMTKLRHLEVDASCLLVSMPPGIGKLTQLETLPAFVVGKEDGRLISELRDLRNLQGNLSIFRLENVSSPNDAKEAALDNKEFIHKLELHWSKSENVSEVLESLQPHPNISELVIVGYGGRTFPTWTEDPGFIKLTTITLHDCRKCTQLPALWKLPDLRYLSISHVHSIDSFDSRLCRSNMNVSTTSRILGWFLGRKPGKKEAAFPKLQILTLNVFPKLKKWIGMKEDDYPLLRELNISSCSQLRSLPEFSVLKSLEQLAITDCPLLESVITDKGVPNLLNHLAIIDCPKLTNRCLTKDRDILASIDDVWIDSENMSPAQTSPESGISPVSSVCQTPDVTSEIVAQPSSKSGPSGSKLPDVPSNIEAQPSSKSGPSVSKLPDVPSNIEAQTSSKSGPSPMSSVFKTPVITSEIVAQPSSKSGPFVLKLPDVPPNIEMHRKIRKEPKSQRDTTKRVMDALKTDHLNMVGVFGIPGVGKTFLTEEIMKQVRDEELFDQVVLVTVSRNPNIRGIQKDMARQLGLHFTKGWAAAELSGHLSGGQKVLVVLDDIWERLDLRIVGIPYKTKVLFTTRTQSVCDEMETEEESGVKIRVEVFSEYDSWELFRQKAGDVVDYPAYRGVADDVLYECKGLPFAIVTLGLALRSKEVIMWSDAHTQLKQLIYNNHTGRAAAVVKLSYKFLHGDKAAQMCLLYCSLFPEGFWIEINVLLSYLLGEKLLEDVNNIEQARQRLHVIVDKLTSSGLLLKSKEGDIMMHRIIRDTAICIASKEGEGFIVKSGLGLQLLPICQEIENCKRLSLMSNDLTYMPNFTGSLLSILSLSENKKLQIIPHDFFKEMKQLKTLDLSSTGIRSLPPSIQCLQSLHTLLMEKCFYLSNICLVGELQRLEILSFRDSKEVLIPKSMQKLTNLVILNASNTKDPFPPQVISSLYQLEELYLGAGTVKDFSEVAFLDRLTCLEICLPVECFLGDSPSHLTNLSKFSISVGRQEGLNGSEQQLGTRGMLLDLRSATQNPSIRILNWVGTLLEKTEHLEVAGIGHLRTVAELNKNGTYHSSLRFLSVSDCKQLRHLLSTTSATTKARKHLFSNIEELHLKDLQDFISILDGPLPEGFLFKLKKLEARKCHTVSILIPFDLLGNLQKLEELELSYCSGLKKLVELEGSMSPSLIFPCLRKIEISDCSKLNCVIPLKASRHLLQLEELEIRYCSDVEVIFENDGGENANKDKLILPRLKTLQLVLLPSLLSFATPGLFLDFPALVKMEVKDCESWKMLPLFDAHSIPKLKKLELDSGWLDELKWNDENLKFHLKSLPGLVESLPGRWH